MKKGFTLIEMLISIALMTIIGTVAVAMVSTVLRSSKDTTQAGNIRQSGNYVTQQISDIVRYATQFKVNKTTNPINDTDPNTYTTDCTALTTPIHYLELTTTTNTAVFVCDESVTPPISLNGAPLIDTTEVKVVSCSFTCSQSSSSSAPTIGVTFTLSQVTPPGITPLPENNVTLPFSTSTLMRNINN